MRTYALPSAKPVFFVYNLIYKFNLYGEFKMPLSKADKQKNDWIQQQKSEVAGMREAINLKTAIETTLSHAKARGITLKPSALQAAKRMEVDIDNAILAWEADSRDNIEVKQVSPDDGVGQAINRVGNFFGAKKNVVTDTELSSNRITQQSINDKFKTAFKKSVKNNSEDMLKDKRLSGFKKLINSAVKAITGKDLFTQKDSSIALIAKEKYLNLESASPKMQR